VDPATSAAVRVNWSSWLQRRQNLPEALGASVRANAARAESSSISNPHVH
jgi:hypothetical protein